MQHSHSAIFDAYTDAKRDRGPLGHVGATLRMDLPKPGAEISDAKTITEYLAHDGEAADVVFALYTSMPAEPGQPRPHAATIAALTGSLTERGMSIRDGLLVGNDTVSPYDGDPPGTVPAFNVDANHVRHVQLQHGLSVAVSPELLRKMTRPKTPTKVMRLPHRSPMK
ncbi:DUF4192 family protein [Arthrobacter sp. MSA 4-2]|uniref:DUF4192 family protein n=1 Tax=Arthrobacter sp. MSA 4-2 TaxID=2794349 RepID=UPI0027DE7878|nr:DUF4192 family protein [Arthrobacter sp. MSA 4-2]